MRLVFVALLVLANVSFARTGTRNQEWYPLEQTISRTDVPYEAAGKSVFGAGIDLSGQWLAISETVWSDSEEPGAVVHLFHRTTGKKLRPWRWEQSIEADSLSGNAVDTFPEFPLALVDDELAVAVPWPGGLVIHRLDGESRWVEHQSISDAFGKSVWPRGKMLMSNRLLAFSNVGGSLFVFSRNEKTGEWAQDREFPPGFLRGPNDFFLVNDQLALIRAGSHDLPAHIEVHRRSADGTWLDSEVIELFDRNSFSVFSGSLHMAFDGDELIVLCGDTDFLGNPLGSGMQRFRRDNTVWAEVDQIEIPYLSSRVAAEDGCILVHGYAPDFLGNPLIGQPAMFDRGFHRRGNIPAPVGTVSLNGTRFAASAVRVDFIGNIADAYVRIHRNPWAGWFRHK